MPFEPEFSKDNAVRDLYGDWSMIDEFAIRVLDAAMNSDDREKIYDTIKREENKNKEIRMSELKKR